MRGNDALQVPLVIQDDDLRGIAEGEVRRWISFCASGVPGRVVKL
jgi:hypothetical protein